MDSNKRALFVGCGQLEVVHCLNVILFHCPWKEKGLHTANESFTNSFDKKFPYGTTANSGRRTFRMAS